MLNEKHRTCEIHNNSSKTPNNINTSTSGNFPQYQWVKCDDDIVTSIGESEVVVAEAYILMYTKRAVLRTLM